ncbi:MAG TPA: hypothetical protein VHV08_03355 [Pirellulales bacterium]|nr:hypothetical protein [Pirellulales bacterium]
MVKHVSLLAGPVALALIVASAAGAQAQDAVLSELYGSGVHQYFSGNYSQAVTDLSVAVNGGTKDPRVLYFRALAEMRLGQQGAAQADMQRGALLESADATQLYPVGKSLERVQGSQRMLIERYRAVARAEAHQRQQRRDSVRYEQRRRAETQVLRNPAPLPAPVAPAPAAEAPASEDPFADDADKNGAPPAANPPDEAPEDDKQAPAAKDGEDPFGEPPAEEGDEMKEEPAADAKEGDQDNPFGDDDSKDGK